MEKVNLKLGITLGGRELYYPLDGRSDNRSILFMGRSGCGKSTAISLFEKQLTTYGKKVIEVDFSDSTVVNDLGDCSRVIDIKNASDFSPLARHYNVYGFPESDVDFAQRIANLITPTSSRSEMKQQSILYRAIKDIASRKDIITFSDICRRLREEKQPPEAVLIKLGYFEDAKVFSTSMDTGSDWMKIFMHPKPIQVLSLSGFPRLYRKIIAELLLSDLENFLVRSGPGKFDFVLVLDECQNLHLSLGMPTAFFLSQGRKYGCGTWLATQSPGYFKREELAQLYQPALTLNFETNDDERSKICRKLETNDNKRGKLFAMFQKIQRGQFIASGHFIKMDGTLSDYGHLIVSNVL